MMKRHIIILILIVVSYTVATPVFCHNPFTSKPENQHKTPAPLIKNRFFVKIILWQHQLKQKMSELIRDTKTATNMKPLLFLTVFAFTYGAVHAAGPGHGKFVATSFVLSHKATITGGILFGVFFASLHGFSGAAGVLGLRYIIQKGVSETLGSVTSVTQIISYGLIALLGCIVFLKNIYAFIKKTEAESSDHEQRTTRKGLLSWAIAAGMVPCPAVVMVMLFCLSMDTLTLGLLLAACISLGMATTISGVVIIVILGKTGVLQSVSQNRVEIIERILGIGSGAAVMAFGLVFLFATLA
ncbi:MAG: hypothetical protein K9L30_08410 [Desulfobacterales bacterium]|nr:hypothetical protein [Desulfobacterales bacterium]